MDSELAGVAGNTGYPAGEQRTWHRVPDQWLGQEGGGDIDSGTREHWLPKTWHRELVREVDKDSGTRNRDSGQSTSQKLDQEMGELITANR